MIHRVFILEVANEKSDVFLNVVDAKDFAYNQLIKWGYDPKNDEDEVFKELDESYKDERYAGFWVDDLIWCYEANYHY